MLDNLKIGTRLGIGFALTSCLLICILVFGYIRVNMLDDSITNIVNDRFPKTAHANNVINALNLVAQQLRNAYIYSGEERNKALESIPPLRQIITDNLAELDKTVKSEKGREILKKITMARAEYVTELNKFFELLKLEKRDEIITLFQTDLHKTQDAYMNSVNELIKFQSGIMEKEGKDADQLAHYTENLLLIFGLIALSLSILCGWSITKTITKPISELLRPKGRSSSLNRYHKG